MKKLKSSIFLVVGFAACLALLASCGGGGGDSGSGSGGSTYPPSYANAKIIFVTHTIDNGNLKNWMPECSNQSTGLAAADCICQEHAVRWGNLSGTYKAWLSDSTTSASQRLNHSTQPYVNRRGEQIAANWTALTNGAMQCNDMMNYDESGEPMSTQFNMVWTGTDSFGNIPAGTLRNCSNWTSGTASGAGAWVGLTTSISPNFGGCWTNWGWRLCDDWNRLYCVEQ